MSMQTRIIDAIDGARATDCRSRRELHRHAAWRAAVRYHSIALKDALSLDDDDGEATSAPTYQVDPA